MATASGATVGLLGGIGTLFLFDPFVTGPITALIANMATGLSGIAGCLGLGKAGFKVECWRLEKKRKRLIQKYEQQTPVLYTGYKAVKLALYV